MLTQEELSKRQGGYIDVSPDSMPPTKIRAFMEEFPWIKKHIEGPIVQAYVSGVESSLLNYSPERIDGGIDLFGSNWIFERILLLDEEDEEVTAEIEEQRKKFFFFGPVVLKVKRISGMVLPGSSVGSVVERLGEKADSIRFMVSYYGYTKAVIVYKLPKGVSLKQWIEKEVAREKEEYRKSMADAITVATSLNLP